MKILTYVILAPALGISIAALITARRNRKDAERNAELAEAAARRAETARDRAAARARQASCRNIPTRGGDHHGQGQ